MRDRGPYVGGVVDLPQLKSAEDRRAVWRQTLVTLARGGGGPGPLEGLHPDALLAAVRTALADGLVDDTGWLADAAAGAALYELAAVIPPSNEQRELGRRVLARLLQGSAETFTAIATRMALGTGKGLAAAHVRARVSLVVELPFSAAVGDGPLCLALVARRQLARDFVVGPSTASLPARRSAALILEHAAREAARRAQQGDEHAMRAFVGEGVAQAFERLLADREPLVWRRAAAARGMLAPWNRATGAALQASLDPKLSPTEWRRAATSIAALMSVDPEQSKKLVKLWMSDGGPLARDPGGAGAFVWGLARAAEAEPDAAAEILARLTERSPLGVAEAVRDLAADWGGAGPFEHSIGKIVQAIRNHDARDEGEEAVNRELLRELERLPRTRASKSDAEPRADDPLDVQVSRALATFGAEGARPAYALAKKAFEDMHGLLDALEATGDDSGSAVARRTALTVLRQLDHALLERSVLGDLMRLAPSPDAATADEAALGEARDRIAAWVLERFRERESEDAASSPVRDPTLRLQRLRALLHLVDSDLDEDEARSSATRKGWSRIASVLLRRMEKGLPPMLRRANAATLARTLDALVRAEALDPADALLVVVSRVADPGELHVLAEASMDPSLRHALARWADFARSVSDAEKGEPASALGAELEALEAWARDGLLDPSRRAEALRTVVTRLHRACAAIARARSLSELCTEGGTDADVVAAFETALGLAAQLAVGARARLDAALAGASTHGPALAVGVARVLSGVDTALSEAARDAARAAAHEAPPALESVAVRAIDALAALPAREAGGRAGAVRMNEALPPWLPARRTLGGFYVIRPLASGGGGSVLVAVRIEERGEQDAERFALKVPAYDASAARTVSETEFFEMFRAEASALIAVPEHPHLARFVTFDSGSKPKPILVMELVEGQNLDHEIASGALDVPRALKLLDDVLAGLEAMHGVEVGHLDLKPSNVVLRQGRDAVLVDFGLAGRRIRPGCATGPYGAPEVWAGNHAASPRAADVYAFGCVAYEALTGDVLFRADSELTQIAMHLAHDGFPDKLRALAGKPALQPVAELLFSTLRRDPSKRPTVPQLRGELRRLAPSLASARWPL
ncbi:MAG TPA: serine/threonine-protein kinase [Polyangiaceae bacterium]|jgi:serine/threonine protein kinase